MVNEGFKANNLIKNEYFPLELPPCFNTNDLSMDIETIIKWVNSDKKDMSVPYTFSGFKTEYSRRKFAVPNPYHYIKTVDIIVNNSKQIFEILDESTISLSKPIKGTPDNNKPYKKITNSVNDTRNQIESLYQNNHYQINLDINSFFDSIYTHSIPWAIHGKTFIKKKENIHNQNLIGNILDNCMQSMNYKQTNGILIGNSISRIISEIILCTVDKEIQNRFKNIACKRFVDDYYIFVKETYEIQTIISFIRNELAKYELILNENKIEIKESPFLYGNIWINELKLYIHLKSDLFIDKVISLYLKYKDISILKYGIKILSTQKFSKDIWVNIESKIVNIWTKYPSLSNLVAPIFIKNIENLNKKNLKKAIYSILDKNIFLNNHQEVMWAVWIAKIFKINIRSEYLVKIINSDNDIAIIIILDMINQGICKKSNKVILSVENLKTNLDSIEKIMFSSRWLLAYEIDLNNWFEDFRKAREDSFFRKMINRKVRFYISEFKYENLVDKGKNTEYVTKEEFYRHINRINDLIGKNDNKSKNIIIKENKEFMDKIESTLDVY